MIDLFERMAQNNAWANATLYRAAQHLPESAFHGPAPGYFPTLAKTLNHIYEVDLYYLDALEETGAGRSVYQREDIQNITALATQQAILDGKLTRFCGGLTDQTLREMRQTERHSGVVVERVSDLLLHLFQHQIHHRGQAHVQLHTLGIEPPQLDEFYLKFDRAPTAQAYGA